MNVQLLVDPYKELQSQTFHGINLERVYCTVNANTFFIYTMQMSDLWGLYSSSGTSKLCNSFCPWWSRHPIVSKRAPLARLQCVQFGLCVISERLLYWRSSSVSYCLWRAESMVLCWQDWWGNSYKDCGGNMALSLVIFLTYCVAWNVCGSLQLLCFAGTNNATVCVPYTVCKTSITGYFSLSFDYSNIWDDWLFWWSIGRS